MLRSSFALPLVLLSVIAGCKSPEDIGFDAGAKYVSIFAAVGADTKTMPCNERIALAQEFLDKGKAGRAEIVGDVKGAKDEDGFDAGLGRITEIRPRVFEAFAKDCPAEAPTLVEIMKTAETELGLEGKLPPLQVPTDAPAE